MSGRIMANPTLFRTPVQRFDRSLIINWGNSPDGSKDDDYMFTMWAIDDWPLHSGNVLDGTVAGNWPLTNRTIWVEDVQWCGTLNFPYRIAGITKDSGGSPIAGVNVDLYTTVADVLVASMVSDANGIFSFGVQDSTTKYYIRAWRLAPPIQGTSVDTLVGA